MERKMEMNKKNEQFTHMEYRNAKIVHLIEQDQSERFIYKKKEITKEEAIVITANYLKEKEARKKQKVKKEVVL